jgi:hypothetical protein
MFGLFHFFWKAKEYASQSEAMASPNQGNFDRKIILFGAVGGTIGFLNGVANSIAAWQVMLKEPHPDTSIALIMPFLQAAAGILGGACWTGAFAPDEFLTGPAGAKWMRVVGARRPRDGRFISLLFALLCTAFIIGMWVCVAIGRV